MYLWAEDSCAVTGNIFLVALVEVTLGFMAVTALAGTLAKGEVGTAAGVGHVALGVAQIGQGAGHPRRAVLILVRRWLKLIQRRRSPHPLDAVDWKK